MHYLIYLVPVAFSLLLIKESWMLGTLMEWLFRMEPDSFYDRSRKHAKLVAVMKWPFLLALLGLAIPSPWSLDFLLAFVTGFIVGWKDFRQKEPKQLPAPDVVVVWKPDKV